MNAPTRCGSLPHWIIALVVALVTFVGIGVIQPQATSAHPLDEFPELTYLTISPTTITVELDLTPGVLLAADTLTQIDTNSDDTVSDAEARAYVEMMLGSFRLALMARPFQSPSPRGRCHPS